MPLTKDHGDSERNPTEYELGRTMHYWLQRTTRELREDANLTAGDIAYVSGMDAGTVSRWEDHTISWPRGEEVEKLIVAYAEMCGVQDARHIWKIAVNRFQNEGGAPRLSYGQAKASGPVT
jgi:hypothetical protein